MKMTRRNKQWSGGVWLGGVALLTAVRCGAGGNADLAAAPGQERAGESTDVAEDPSRELQESDIYKRVGDRMFILNRFRGLMVANATNLDAPVLEGRMPLPAEPREMWLANDTALIITAQEDAYSGWGWWGDSTNVDVDTWASYKGSALVLANVSNPQHPQLSSILKLGGDCFDGRLRGSILYVACSAAAWSPDGGASSHIFSVDVSNPEAPLIVGSAGFDRGGADQHLMVGDNMMYLASVNANARSTNILMVDISAPDGTITRRGTVTVPLAVPDRFAMDAYNGALRVASGSAGNADVHLTTFDITNPDAPVQLGQYTLMINESLKSARFDANRGYLVTFRNVDPLYVFDLTNPAQPRILGELKMPGWLDFMVPMGDRLICMGHDDITQTQSGTLGLVRMTRRTLAVSLIDVSSSGPRVLSRVPLDGSWGTIPAERDDYNKLFRVFPNEGLVMFPYRTFSSYGYARQAGMLLIDWANDALTLKADLNNIGLVERGILWDASTLVTLSVQVMQVFDIADRANPRARGAVELARQVSAFAKVGDNHLVELSGDIGVGSATLNARALGGVDPDAAPLSSVTLDSPAGFIQANGNLVYVVGVHNAAMPSAYDDDSKGEPEVPTTITVVDYADPAHPVVRSSLTLPEEVTFWNQGVNGYATDVVVQPSAGVLVLQKPPYYGGYGCSDSSKPAKLFVLDLRNPDAPTLAKTLDGPRWGAQMEGGGGRVFVVDYQAVSVLDVRDPSNVKMGKDVKAENVLATNPATGDVLRMQYGYSSSGLRTTQQEQALLLDRLGDDGLRAVSRLPTQKYFYGGRLVNGWYWGSDYQSTGLVKVDGDTLGWVDVAGTDLALNGSGRLVAATGDTVFVETGNAIQVLRSSGGTMGQRMTIKVAGRADSAMLHGDVVYVAAGYHGLVRVPLAQ